MPDAPSIFVASPIYNDQCYGGYTSGLLKLQGQLMARGGKLSFQWLRSASDLAKARNVLAADFLYNSDASHLLFIDADMEFRAEDVMRMLDYDYDVMAAICTSKQINWDRAVQLARENPDMTAEEIRGMSGVYYTLNGLRNEPLESEPVQVLGIGTGIMLIKRQVFERMLAEDPDNRMPVDGAMRNAFPHRQWIPNPFGTEPEPGQTRLSEDLSFCRRWRERHGGEVWACPWFVISHMGTYGYLSDMPTLVRRGAYIVAATRQPGEG